VIGGRGRVVLLLALMLPKGDYGGINFVAAGGFSPD
jgi:hypothetical protein